jgi:hypothetical protein
MIQSAQDAIRALKHVRNATVELDQSACQPTNATHHAHHQVQNTNVTGRTRSQSARRTQMARASNSVSTTASQQYMPSATTKKISVKHAHQEVRIETASIWNHTARLPEMRVDASNRCLVDFSDPSSQTLTSTTVSSISNSDKTRCSSKTILPSRKPWRLEMSIKLETPRKVESLLR